MQFGFVGLGLMGGNMVHPIRRRSGALERRVRTYACRGETAVPSNSMISRLPV